ncbi:hypothetical protein [Blastococcus sp. VKM Ac-2987]|uniref:hypothetical protein n=1 Tax=Blastococcus sp. VKM Ac-2987 TaxID=3004141 RepID=UPI0022AB6F17|nr:hypothetical protein [Blastococcus sp. VKM Ac-2987]MCZ2859855.1 hypothetical protein [Blastococcus sp. VKM Ac-2987]
MTSLATTVPPTTTLPTAPATSPAEPGTGARGAPPRLLAVVLDRDTALGVLDAAYSSARDTGREVHTAILLPRTTVPLDPWLLPRLGEQADQEACDLIALARQRAAAHGVASRISVHHLGGLHGRRRQRVVDRAVARLARRLDAVPVGWTSS